MVREIFHVAATVSDIEKSLEIYRDFLGMKLLHDTPRQGEWIDRLTGLEKIKGRTAYLTPDGLNRVELIQIYHPPVQCTELHWQRFTGVFYVALRVWSLEEVRSRLPGNGTWSEVSDSRLGRRPLLSWVDHDKLRWEIVEENASPGEPDTNKPLSIDHIGILVSDLASAKEFYGETLGLEIVKEGEIGRKEATGTAVSCKTNFVRFRSPAGQFLELHQLAGVLPKKRRFGSIDWIGFTHVGFIVENAREMYRILKEQGLEFVAEPQEIRSGPNKGAIGFFVFDPDRISLEIFEFPK